MPASKPRMPLPAALALALATACVGQIDPGGGGDDVGGDDDDAPPRADAGPGGGGEADAGPVAAACAEIPLDAVRPVDFLGPARLGEVADRLPCVTDTWLAGVLESPDTMFYDKHSLVPGYQDSFGDNVIAPIGFRPNTIDPQLINLAVPGGHQQIFVAKGLFHFPFGNPIGSGEQAAVIDFWHVPRGGDGALLPVVWWQRDPNQYTHRVEWIFPRGTVFGELIFIVAEDGRWIPFEIRTRTRELDRWAAAVYRPFPTATSLAAAIQARRGERPEWAQSAEIDALLAALADGTSLTSAQLGATHFAGAFATVTRGKDTLPGLGDWSLLETLLTETPYVSAAGQVWKSQAGLVAYAPTVTAGAAIVPPGYTGGFVEVSDDSCARCHADAGRPFRDWYDNILAYGELWGNDEVFTWHPFDIPAFVDESGDVVDFNYDNRELRDDFVLAGLVVAYDGGAHGADVYKRIVRGWTDFSY